ncbi:MAG TPA: aldehyde dehydrogenase family protein [Capillimicrobium sp.]
MSTTIVTSAIAGMAGAGDREVTELVDPATGEALVPVANADESDVEQALAAAAGAAPRWAQTAPAERADMLRRAADLLEERADELVDALVREAGKPLGEARGETAKSIATYRYYAGLGDALDGRSMAGGRPGLRHETRREPIGPVVAISAWNVPAAGPARKLAPALLGGNPVIVKPAGVTPLSSLVLVGALRDAGVPDDVAQVVCGRGEPVGRLLATDPRVAAVSFTGSTRVGLGLKGQLSGRLTRLQLELGGKNAALVLADADLDAAAEHIVAAAFALAGQQCTATSRIVVEDAVHDALLERVVARSAALRLGDTRDAATQMGPLISARHRDDVHGFVVRARDAGARVELGGELPDGPGFAYPPTILSAVDPESELAREEVFGPVVAVLRCSTLADGVRLVNDTAYGLSSAVHTNDLRAAREAVAGIDAGVVSVNGPTAGIELPAPFGGFKQSGTDSKEHGPESMAFYTRTKLVSWGA